MWECEVKDDTEQDFINIFTVYTYSIAFNFKAI